MFKLLSKLSLLLLINVSVFAQRDTTRLNFRTHYIPTGIRLGTDLIPIARKFYDESFKGYEFNVDVDMYRYYLTVDYGNWGRNYAREDGLSYSNNGNYWRAGVDVNFLTRDPERNMFFIGMRYGRSKFNEDFFLIDQLGNIAIREIYTNEDVTARWFELTTGVRVKMWKAISMGYTARYKFGLNTSDTPTMEPHDIPGYGRTDKKSYWGFNYQLFVRIPTRPYPPLLPKKKKK